MYVSKNVNAVWYSRKTIILKKKTFKWQALLLQISSYSKQTDYNYLTSILKAGAEKLQMRIFLVVQLAIG